MGETHGLSALPQQVVNYQQAPTAYINSEDPTCQHNPVWFKNFPVKTCQPMGLWKRHENNTLLPQLPKGFANGNISNYKKP